MCSLHLRRSLIGVVTLAVALLGAGCEEEDPSDPVASPSGTSDSAPTSPSEPTTDAGPVEPTLPPEAEADTKAGAQAFVKFYWDVVNYARRTGDVSHLRELSVASCAGCNGGIESIEQIYERGGRILGGRFELLSAVPGRTASGACNVSARVKVNRSRTVGAGDLNKSVRAGEVDFLFGLAYRNGSWLTTFLDTP